MELVSSRDDQVSTLMVKTRSGLILHVVEAANDDVRILMLPAGSKGDDDWLVITSPEGDAQVVPQ